MKKFLKFALFAFFAAVPAAGFAAKLEPFFTANAIKNGGLGKEELALVIEGSGPAKSLNAPKDVLVKRLGMLMSEKFGFNQADGFSPADVVKVVRASDVVSCSWERGQVLVDSLDAKNKNLIRVFTRLPYEGEKCLSYKGVQYISLKCGNTLNDNRPIKAAKAQPKEAAKKSDTPASGEGAPKREAAARAEEAKEGAVAGTTITLISDGAPVTVVPVSPRREIRSFYLSACSGGWCPQMWSPYNYGYYGGFGWGGLGGWNLNYTYGPETPPGNTTLPRGGNGSGWGNMVFPPSGGLGVGTR